MPYDNVPEDKWGEMDSCVDQVEGKVDDPYAVCYASVVEGKSLKTLLDNEKAGARHSAMDAKDIQEMRKLAKQLLDLTGKQGAADEEEVEEDPKKKSQKDWYGEPSYASPPVTSFADLDATREAQEVLGETTNLVYDFQQVMAGITASPDIKDKKAALVQAAGEFQKRATAAAKKESIFQKLKNKFSPQPEVSADPPGLKEVITPPAPDTAKVVEDVKSGKRYLMLQTSNAFQDRDGETFTTQAIKNYAATAPSGMPVDYWHTSWDIGEVIWTGYSDRMLFELIDPYPSIASKELVQHVADHPTYWGASHKFQYSEEEKKDGVFRQLRKVKSTLLPIKAASNPFTAAAAVDKEHVMLTKEKIEELRKVLTPEGFAAAMNFVSGEEDKSQRLEQAGVSHKEGPTTPTPPQEPPPPDDPPDEPPDPMAGFVAVLKAELGPIATRLAALEEKEKARGDMPRIFNMAGLDLPASKSPATALTGVDVKDIGPGNEPMADPMVASIFSMFGGAPASNP